MIDIAEQLMSQLSSSRFKVVLPLVETNIFLTQNTTAVKRWTQKWQENYGHLWANVENLPLKQAHHQGPFSVSSSEYAQIMLSQLKVRLLK